MTRYTPTYALEPTLSVMEFKRTLLDSGLAATRPVEDEARLAAMLAGANLIVTARLDAPGRPLVGIARGITDHVWCCYLAEVAVVASAQGMGIGRGLLAAARRHLGPQVSLILVSMPEAAGFYERAGMQQVANTFWWRRQG